MWTILNDFSRYALLMQVKNLTHMVRFLSQGFYFSILPTLIVNRENSDFLRKISEKLFHKIIG